MNEQNPIFAGGRMTRLLSWEIGMKVRRYEMPRSCRAMKDEEGKMEEAKKKTRNVLLSSG